MDLQSNARIALGLAAFAYLGFYVYGLIMGVFSPGEVLGFTVAAVVLAAWLLVHAARADHAMRSQHDPAHNEVMRAVRSQREKRGF